MRIFLDTNVLASAIATRGLCAELFEALLHDHELLTCDAVVGELERVLQAKLRLAASVATEFCSLVRSEGEVVTAQQTPTSPIADADDLPIVSCALGGKADLFVTGDKALLERKSSMECRSSPRELWERLGL